MHIRHLNRVDLAFVGPANTTRQFELVGQIQCHTSEEGKRFGLGEVVLLIIERVSGHRIRCNQRDVDCLLRCIELNLACFVERADHEIEHPVKVTGQTNFLSELAQLVVGNVARQHHQECPARSPLLQLELPPE